MGVSTADGRIDNGISMMGISTTSRCIDDGACVLTSGQAIQRGIGHCITSLQRSGPVILTFVENANRSQSRLEPLGLNNWTGPDL